MCISVPMAYIFSNDSFLSPRYIWRLQIAQGVWFSPVQYLPRWISNSQINRSCNSGDNIRCDCLVSVRIDTQLYEQLVSFRSIYPTSQHCLRSWGFTGLVTSSTYRLIYLCREYPSCSDILLHLFSTLDAFALFKRACEL